MKRAVILLAHGSRDPGWRLPVERLRRALARRLPDVGLAYLESTRPDLETLVARYARRGYRRLTIVPVFLGSGRHLKRDLAAKARAFRAAHKDVRIDVQRAIGEQAPVIAAIAAAMRVK